MLLLHPSIRAGHRPVEIYGRLQMTLAVIFRPQNEVVIPIELVAPSGAITIRVQQGEVLAIPPSSSRNLK